MKDGFEPFGKIARLSRECVITEKIDGTNACIQILEDGTFLTGSRTRWITPEDDNYGFSRWAHENKDCLMELGEGQHFGEWWGGKIQRGYGVKEKTFSLFNTHRWGNGTARPDCCDVVPVLFEGMFSTFEVNNAIEYLNLTGSIAATGFLRPEGVVIYHTAARMYFKKTIEKDEEWKGKRK
jgi:hypothetical protein